MTKPVHEMLHELLTQGLRHASFHTSYISSLPIHVHQVQYMYNDTSLIPGEAQLIFQSSGNGDPEHCRKWFPTQTTYTYFHDMLKLDFKNSSICTVQTTFLPKGSHIWLRATMHHARSQC